MARLILDTQAVVSSAAAPAVRPGEESTSASAGSGRSCPPARAGVASDDVIPEVAAAASAISATRSALAGGEESLRWVSDQLHDGLHQIDGIAPVLGDMLPTGLALQGLGLLAGKISRSSGGAHRRPRARSRSNSFSLLASSSRYIRATRPDHGVFHVRLSASEVQLLLEPLLFPTRVAELATSASTPPPTELHFASPSLALSLDTTDIDLDPAAAGAAEEGAATAVQRSQQLVSIKAALRVQTLRASNASRAVVRCSPLAPSGGAAAPDGEAPPAIFGQLTMAYRETVCGREINVAPCGATVQLRVQPVHLDLSPARRSIDAWRLAHSTEAIAFAAERDAARRSARAQRRARARPTLQRRSSPVTLLHTCFRPTPSYVGPTVAVAISAGEVRLSTQVDAAWGAVNVKGGVVAEAEGVSREGVPREPVSWSQQISVLDLCVQVRMRSVTMDGERKYLLAPVTVVAAMKQQRTTLATTVDVSTICLYVSYRQLEALRYAFFVERSGSSAALRRARRFARRSAAPVRPYASTSAPIENRAPWLDTDTSMSVRAPEVIITIALIDVPSLPLRSSQMVRARIDTLVLSRTTTFQRRALPRSAGGSADSAGAGARGAGGKTSRTALSVSLGNIEVCEVTRPTLPALPSEALRHIYRFIKQRRHTPVPSPRTAPLSSPCDGDSAAAVTIDEELSEEEDVDGNDGCGWNWRSIGFFLLRAQQGRVRGACLDPLQTTPADGAPSQVPLPLLVTAVGSEPGSLFHCDGPFFTCEATSDAASVETSIAATVKPFDLTLRLHTIEALKALAYRPKPKVKAKAKAPARVRAPVEEAEALASRQPPPRARLSIVLEQVQLIVPVAPMLAGGYEETHLRIQASPIRIARGAQCPERERAPRALPAPALGGEGGEALTIEIDGTSVGRGQWFLHPVRDLAAQRGLDPMQVRVEHPCYR